MPPSINVVPVQAFVLDQAFTDRTNTINDILINSSSDIAALSPKALTYFNDPAVFVDSRSPSARAVNWAATTSAKIVVDEQSFSNFVSTINLSGSTTTVGFFKIIDKLVFNYSGTNTEASIETYLTTDSDISPLYVPDSFSISAVEAQGTLYNVSGQPEVPIPSFVTFTIAVLSGSTLQYYQITLFALVSAFLVGYSVSTIETVIPPLPYSRLYADSLIASVSNEFNIASITATLSYNTAQAMLSNTTISGMVSYPVQLVDVNNNRVTVPFNILYKGQSPTQEAIRQAIVAKIAASSVGTEAGWKLRVPGLYILGRYYILPLWDQTFAKPDQILFPNINGVLNFRTITNKIFRSLGSPDLTPIMDVLSVYYNRMTVIAIPDQSGPDELPLLQEVLPDYQDFSTVEENFAYMSTVTQNFSASLNSILAYDNVGTLPSFIPSTEGLFTFYTFDDAGYEFCVITKDCYTTIMESS